MTFLRKHISLDTTSDQDQNKCKSEKKLSRETADLCLRGDCVGSLDIVCYRSHSKFWCKIIHVLGQGFCISLIYLELTWCITELWHYQHKITPSQLPNSGLTGSLIIKKNPTGHIMLRNRDMHAYLTARWWLRKRGNRTDWIRNHWVQEITHVNSTPCQCLLVHTNRVSFHTFRKRKKKTHLELYQRFKWIKQLFQHFLTQKKCLKNDVHQHLQCNCWFKYTRVVLQQHGQFCSNVVSYIKL